LANLEDTCVPAGCSVSLGFLSVITAADIFLIIS